MDNTNEDLATFEYVGFGYTLEEATKLMHQEVMYTNQLKQKKTLQNTGLVSGILHINEQIELVVQLYEGVSQFTKSEFEAQLTIITDETV
jgi:hypothetical protein